MDTSSTTFWLTKPLSLIGIDPAKVGNFILPFLGILMLPMTPNTGLSFRLKDSKILRR